MNQKTLFLVGCLPTRILLILLIRFLPKNFLPYISWIFLLISISFLVVYNRRMKGIYDKYAWWNDLRPIHSCLYLLTFIYTFYKNPYSWVPLTIDILIGIISFSFHYTLVGSSSF